MLLYKIQKINLNYCIQNLQKMSVAKENYNSKIILEMNEKELYRPKLKLKANSHKLHLQIN